MRVTSRGEELGTITNTEACDEGSFELFMCRGYEASLDVVDGGVGRESQELGRISRAPLAADRVVHLAPWRMP